MSDGDHQWANEQEIRERRRKEWGPIDFSHITIRSIPADDPIYREGTIITFPIVPRDNNGE